MSNTRTFIIATRGSALALAQARAFQNLCQARFPAHRFELKIFKTTGDKLQTASLADQQLPKGLFTKELEVALAQKEADFAVHSLKDLPTELPPGLVLGSVGIREDVRDVIVGRDSDWPFNHATEDLAGLLAGFRSGDVVATSSTRRAAQLKEWAPQIRVTTIRGNVGTRIRKISEDYTLKATLLAAAGLHRLGMEITPAGLLRSKEGATEVLPAGVRALYLPATSFLPCVGQAAVGIEVRESDPVVQEVCDALNHAPTWQAVAAERGFLNAMGGGCQAAVAAYATVHETQLKLQAVSYLRGHAQRAQITGLAQDAERLGRELAQQLL